MQIKKEFDYMQYHNRLDTMIGKFPLLYSVYISKCITFDEKQCRSEYNHWQYTSIQLYLEFRNFVFRHIYANCGD